MMDPTSIRAVDGPAAISASVAVSSQLKANSVIPKEIAAISQPSEQPFFGARTWSVIKAPFLWIYAKICRIFAYLFGHTPASPLAHNAAIAKNEADRKVRIEALGSLKIEINNYHSSPYTKPLKSKTEKTYIPLLNQLKESLPPIFEDIGAYENQIKDNPQTEAFTPEFETNYRQLRCIFAGIFLCIDTDDEQQSKWSSLLREVDKPQEAVEQLRNLVMELTLTINAETRYWLKKQFICEANEKYGASLQENV